MATTLSDLAEQSHEFDQPNVQIKINNSLLDGEWPKEVVVELSASFQASACRVVFSLPFVFGTEPDTMCLANDMKNKVLLGNKVEVLLGYGEKAKRVFIGYIDSISMEYVEDEAIALEAECLDIKGIMMNSRHSMLHKGFMRYSEAAEWVINQYTSLLGLSVDIDKSDDQITVPVEQHNESDYDFLVRLAQKINYHFYTENEKIVFKSKSSLNKSVVIAYKKGDYLDWFRMETSLKNKVSKVFVIGNNEKDPTKPFQATVDTYENLTTGGSTRAGSISRLLTDRVSLYMADPTIGSAAEAEKRAKALLHAASTGLMTGSIHTPGITAVTPGAVVSVAGFGKEYDKNYYVSKIKHEFKNAQFTTQCELEANNL